MVEEDFTSTGRSPSEGQTVPTSIALAFWRLKLTLERELGVGLGAWFLLNGLRIEEGISQGELCRRHDLDPSRITRLAQRLERDDLISRERDSRDNRVVRMYLTEGGKSFIQERDGKYQAFVGSIEEAFGEEGVVDLERSLDVLVETMKQFGRREV